MAKYFIILFYFAFICKFAYGFKEQELSQEEIDALMLEWQPLQVEGDAIPWEVFAQTDEIEECGIDSEGFDYCFTKPEYKNSLIKLDDTEVTLMGFMFPLDPSEKQKNFLFGPYPLSCPFHYHVGPSQIVEVILQNGIKFSYDPVTVKGKLTLDYNEDTGVFYYLIAE